MKSLMCIPNKVPSSFIIQYKLYSNDFLRFLPPGFSFQIKRKKKCISSQALVVLSEWQGFQRNFSFPFSFSGVKDYADRFFSGSKHFLIQDQESGASLQNSVKRKTLKECLRYSVGPNSDRHHFLGSNPELDSILQPLSWMPRLFHDILQLGKLL